MITVVIVDDHVYIRKAIWYLLEMAHDTKVVATASNGSEAITAARLHRPDVVLMDISMPIMDGLEATRQILADFPNTRVLILSSYDDPEFIKRALECGASGYMVKEALASQLLEAVRALYKGKRYFSREITDKVGSLIEKDSDSWAG